STTSRCTKSTRNSSPTTSPAEWTAPALGSSAAVVGGSCGGRHDRLGERFRSPGRQLVAEPGHDPKLRVCNAFGDIVGRLDGDEGVLRTMKHDGRSFDAFQIAEPVLRAREVADERHDLLPRDRVDVEEAF